MFNLCFMFLAYIWLGWLQISNVSPIYLNSFPHSLSLSASNHNFMSFIWSRILLLYTWSHNYCYNIFIILFDLSLWISLELFPQGVGHIHSIITLQTLASQSLPPHWSYSKNILFYPTLLCPVTFLNMFSVRELYIVWYSDQLRSFPSHWLNNYPSRS